jgi:hypothetical protein
MAPGTAGDSSASGKAGSDPEGSGAAESGEAKEVALTLTLFLRSDKVRRRCVCDEMKSASQRREKRELSRRIFFWQRSAVAG